MKKYVYLILFLFTCFFLTGKVSAETSYDILFYSGDLTIREDNTATYVEEVTYHFDTDYNGQIITLGTAGKMPEGFTIDGNPRVYTDKESSKIEVNDLEDGYEVKVYNGGSKGDKVTVTVEWELTNILFVHDDIWELNWSPISDWQAPINQIELTVQTPFATPKTPSKLYAHTGYFGVPTHVNATEDGYDISISGLPIRGRVELHSYWEKSGITNYSLIENQSTGKKNELAYFKQTEDRIVYGVIFSILFAMIFPILSVSCYLLFRKKIKVGKNYPKDTLLYEIPQNLPPLVVASNIYSVELNEVNPTEKNYSKLKFKNMIQATLLDLIDRGNLKADEKDQKIILTLQHSEGLLPFEKDFVTMAFGEHAQLSTEDLFSDFTISDSIYKELKKNESAIRSAGTKVRINIDRHLNKITRGVNEAIDRQGLVNHYRPLNKNERILINAAIVCSVIPIFTSMDHIYDLFYSSIINANTLFFLVLDILSGALCYFLYQKKKIYIRDGVLNEEGTLQYYYWNSFENMLQQIANLQQAELESIVLWNRILVYATLYGCADKVSDTIKIHQIHINDQNMSYLVDLNLTSALSLSSNRLYNYGKTASAASHFSVSSSDSGGGFSGGGGGGGGGAF